MHNKSAIRSEMPHQIRFAAIALALLAVAHPPTTKAEALCLDYQWSVNTANFTKYDTFIINAHVPVAGGTAMKAAQAKGKKFYAYISAGEIARDAYYHAAAVTAGIPFISENPNWASDVVDLTSPLWGPFVVSQLALPAIQKGFDGFFLDTMDSYYLAPTSWTDQEAGLVSMVKQLKAAYPTKKIIINRGFPVFQALRATVDGMLVEGLYYSYGGSPQQSADTTWLLANKQIGQVVAADLPVYILDYVGGTGGQNLAIANQVADKIAKQGLIPCVVERSLDGTVLAPPYINPNAPLKLDLLRGRRLRFSALANKSYNIHYRDTNEQPWSSLTTVAAQSANRIVELADPLPQAGPTRFYRLTMQ